MTCTSPVRVKKILWISFGEWRGYWFTALGVHTVAGFINKNYPGVDQKVWYYDKKDFPNLLDHLVKNNPDYIFCSVNIGYLEQTLEVVQRIVDSIKSRGQSEPRLVFGNREFLDKTNIDKTLEIFPKSLIVNRDGEESTLGILNHRKLETIPNLCYRKGADLFYTYNKPLDPNKYITPLFEMATVNAAPLNLNRQVAYAEVSRGCSKRPACTFCSNSADPRKWEMLNCAQVLNSIALLAKYKPVAINFVSEDFLGNNDKGIMFFLDQLERMRASGTIDSDTSFYCAIRTTDVYSRKASKRQNKVKKAILKQMKDLGFTTLYLGFESGSNDQLKRYGKGITREENLKAARILKELGFHIDGGFINFDPLMSLQDCLENISFLQEVDVPKLLLFPFNRLVMFPDTTYCRLYNKKKRMVDPKIRKLLGIIEHVDTFIPYGLFESFLQRLRLYYFSNSDKGAIEACENLISSYGNLSLSFLKDLTIALSKDVSASKLDTMTLRFLEKHQVHCNGLRSWFEQQESELFIGSEVPETKDRYFLDVERTS